MFSWHEDRLPGGSNCMERNTNVSQNPHGIDIYSQSCDQHTRKVFRQGSQVWQVKVSNLVPWFCIPPACLIIEMVQLFPDAWLTSARLKKVLFLSGAITQRSTFWTPFSTFLWSLGFFTVPVKGKLIMLRQFLIGAINIWLVVIGLLNPVFRLLVRQPPTPPKNSIAWRVHCSSYIGFRLIVLQHKCSCWLALELRYRTWLVSPVLDNHWYF